MRTCAALILLAAAASGCGTRGPSGGGALDGADPAARDAEVRALCAEESRRPELAARAAGLTPAARLEVLHAAASTPGCLAAFPLDEQLRYWLTHPAAARAEEALAALGAPAEATLAAAVSGPAPGALRAARALLVRWPAAQPAGRAALLAALPGLLEAGLDAGALAPLGDAGLAVLATAPAPAAHAALEALWAKVPAERRGAAIGPALGIALRVRDRYALGSAQWVMLVERAPSFLADIGQLWIRTTHVTVLGDGKEVGSRDWPSGHNLAAPAEVQLELGALAGAALTEEGHHELELVFDAQVVSPGAGGRIDTAAPLWSGKIRTARAAFEVVRVPPAELVTPTTEASLDPRSALVVRLHAGGKSVELWPAPTTPPALELPADEPHASLKATAGAPVSVGLAMELVARAGTGPETVVGRFGVEALAPSPAPRDLTPVDLAPFLKTGKPAKVTLTLRPSDVVAYHHPAITRYWGAPVPLGEVTLTLVPGAPAPAPVPAPAPAPAPAPKP